MDKGCPLNVDEVTKYESISAATTYGTWNKTKTNTDGLGIPKNTPCHHYYKTITEETWWTWKHLKHAGQGSLPECSSQFPRAQTDVLELLLFVQNLKTPHLLTQMTKTRSNLLHLRSLNKQLFHISVE